MAPRLIVDWNMRCFPHKANLWPLQIAFECSQNRHTFQRYKFCHVPEKGVGQVRIQGGTRGPGPPLTLGFKAPKLSIFGPYLIFPYFFLPRFAQCIISLLLFHSSNSKIFQPHSPQHMISHLLLVFMFNLSFTHFRLLGVHLSLSCF